jgi:hypothetical protein
MKIAIRAILAAVTRLQNEANDQADHAGGVQPKSK